MEQDKNVCKTPLYQWTDKLQRPVSRWGLSIMAILYGGRAVIGLPFEETYFLALAGVAGFTYWRRGDEKLKEMEIER